LPSGPSLRAGYYPLGRYPSRLQRRTVYPTWHQSSSIHERWSTQSVSIIILHYCTHVSSLSLVLSCFILSDSLSR
jgi:hypothetical protein